MGSLKKSTHPKHLNTGETLPPGGKDFNLTRIINEFILKVFLSMQFLIGWLVGTF